MKISALFALTLTSAFTLSAHAANWNEPILNAPLFTTVIDLKSNEGPEVSVDTTYLKRGKALRYTTSKRGWCSLQWTSLNGTVSEKKLSGAYRLTSVKLVSVAGEAEIVDLLLESANDPSEKLSGRCVPANLSRVVSLSSLVKAIGAKEVRSEFRAIVKSGRSFEDLSASTKISAKKKKTVFQQTCEAITGTIARFELNSLSTFMAGKSTCKIVNTETADWNTFRNRIASEADEASATHRRVFEQNKNLHFNCATLDKGCGWGFPAVLPIAATAPRPQNEGILEVTFSSVWPESREPIEGPWYIPAEIVPPNVEL